MARRFSFEISVVTVLSCVLALVAAIAVLTFLSLGRIVNEVKEATEPNTHIEVLKQVITDLNNAENSVKSYHLTGDEAYLEPFYLAIESVDNNVLRLHRQSRGDENQMKLADSVEKLVEVKYSILNDFIALRGSETVTGELKNIAQRLRDAEKKRADKEATVERKPNIIQRIFGIKREEPHPVSPPRERINLADVRKEVERTRKEQEKQIASLRAQELELTREDKIVMDKIRAVVMKMENFEKARTARKTIEISRNAKETNFYIGLFCLLATALLGGTFYITISYIKKNKAYRNALSNAKIQAENLARAKETFLANMSHEIRTPMNAIAGFTAQVLQSDLPAKQAEQLLIVKKSADHLLRIINDILDYSKIQSGKLSLDTAGFSPAAVVHETEVLMKPGATDKNLTLNFHVAPSVPPVLLGDAVRLRQILLNLVGNAVKFTEIGSVNVYVSAVPQGATQTALQVTVQDTGTGIPEEKLKSIFNEFEQADTSITRKYGGTGLGLTITRKLIELQNGSIEITSKDGKGTKVNFIIPYTVGSEKDLVVPKPKRLDHSRLKGKKILVADDEMYNRMLIETILKKWETNVTMAGNGEEAVKAASNTVFDAILMDVRMPVMNGIEATKKILADPDPKKSTVPVIALTATTQQKDIDDCIDAGMLHVLSKPFGQDELFNLLVEVLENPGQYRNKTTEKEAEKAPVEKAGKYDLEELRNISNGDEEFVNEMINIFINTTREGLKEMEAHLAAQDWMPLADAAHKIIPPCRHLKANSLLTILKTIELNIREKNKTDNLDTLIAQAREEAYTIIEMLEDELAEKQDKQG